MKELIPFQFKTLNVLSKALEHPWHPILIALHKWMVVRHQHIIMTSSWRPDGIHSMIPLRAEDIRSWVFPNPTEVEADINQHWTYDPERSRYKVALFHGEKGHKHIHLQVHDRTEYKG